MLTGKMIVNEEVFPFTLNQSKAAREFAAMMPLELTMSDYNGTEKISDLPGTLDSSDSPAGSAAKNGDMALYAPWGNLAIFYRPFSYSRGLVILGHLENEEAPFQYYTRDFKARFEID